MNFWVKRWRKAWCLNWNKTKKCNKSLQGFWILRSKIQRVKVKFLNYCYVRSLKVLNMFIETWCVPLWFWQTAAILSSKVPSDHGWSKTVLVLYVPNLLRPQLCSKTTLLTQSAIPTADLPYLSLFNFIFP